MSEFMVAPELLKEARDHNENAINEIGRIFSGYVKKLANSYYRYYMGGNGVYDADDLIQVGRTALLSCIVSFDPESSKDFNQYACSRIRKHIAKYSGDMCNEVYIPEWARTRNHSCYMAMNEYAFSNQNPATADQIAEICNLKKEEVIDSLENMNTWSRFISLENEKEKNENSEFADSSCDPYELAEKAYSIEYIRNAVYTCLADMELKIVCMTFGIDCEPLPLGKICRNLGITRNRGSKIQRDAYNRLRLGLLGLHESA